MSQMSLDDLRSVIRQNYLLDETTAINALIDGASLSIHARNSITHRGADLVAEVRASMTPSLMEAFLAEYGLSTKEGLALMCLAEALLRVPDAETMDDLIEDKIAGGDWAEHAGQSISQLVNVSTMGLQVTNAVLKDGNLGVVNTMRSMVKRLGMPVIRRAVKQVMKELGHQFVLGQNIDSAQKRATALESKGFTHSYDMLGEAAHTASDAVKYLNAYKESIRALARSCSGDVRANSGISIKLSALHPRYEYVNHDRVMNELVPRVLKLAEMAAAANMGLNIDAEEADRLDISLSVIEAVLSSNSLKGWDGFGVVVQAYGKRAPFVIDWLHALTVKLDRKIMVRLVKGAYWDAEIKRAQVMGLRDFPVYTQKAHSDISYVACVAKLFTMIDRIYPQFATHNAHTVAAVLHFAQDISTDKYEFQRLHGMGESLHSVLRSDEGTKCRIYAPVGIHRDLLAYLVRRLLENGANSSFVNQIVDTDIPPVMVAADPFAKAHTIQGVAIKMPRDIFGAERRNAKGWDITDPIELAEINAGRHKFKFHQWQVSSMLSIPHVGKDAGVSITNPANMQDCVGHVNYASSEDVDSAFQEAKIGFKQWSSRDVDDRAKCLERFADLIEDNAYEFFALATREAGKSLLDAIGEVREAVDFLRFYAIQARLGHDVSPARARGVFVCISPWNFPLAIFLGQISAAVVTGNAVLAKPAEQTPLIAARAIELMYESGVPSNVVQLLPGEGSTIGAALTQHPDVAGVCFTGSTATAQHINRAMACNSMVSAPLVAETGGLNAMIVDSTALPEQAVRDIVTAAFQSAGQRCSALRMLYVQEDVKDRFLEMLFGAMDELVVQDPWDITTDVGPVIDGNAQLLIQQYSTSMEADGRLLKKIHVPSGERYVSPAVFSVSGIEELDREIFGPILHVATYKAHELMDVVDTINERGYGLTMGIHSRIDNRVDQVRARAKVGNLYVNRNQIGAVVGSQPFGGEGLSGTGPKAGGPEYLNVFKDGGLTTAADNGEFIQEGESVELSKVVRELNLMPMPDVTTIRSDLNATFTNVFPDHEVLIADLLERLQTNSHDELSMQSPVGESNELTVSMRGIILCMGSSLEAMIAQAIQALYFGNPIIVHGHNNIMFERLGHDFPIYVTRGEISTEALSASGDIAAVALIAGDKTVGQIRDALASRDGKLVPLIGDSFSPYRYMIERHCCTDTSAAGGDAVLLGSLG